MRPPSAAVEWVRDGLARRARALRPGAKITVEAEWLPDDECWRLLVSLQLPGVHARSHAFVRFPGDTDAEAVVGLAAAELPDLIRMNEACR